MNNLKSSAVVYVYNQINGNLGNNKINKYIFDLHVYFHLKGILNNP